MPSLLDFLTSWFELQISALTIREDQILRNFEILPLGYRGGGGGVVTLGID